MTDEERPLGGQEQWAPEQVPEHTAPVGSTPLDPPPLDPPPLDPTVPVQHTMPVSPVPPPESQVPVSSEITEPVDSFPPPTGSPFLYQSPSPAVPPPAAGPQATIPVPGRHNPSPTGRQRLGAGAISAIVAGAVAIAMVAALFGGIAGAFLVSRGESGETSLPPAPVGSVARPPGSIANIAARILPAVVTIKVEGPTGAGTGSGFVMRKDGFILTNNHVVDVATSKGKITVLFSDGKSSQATIIGHDEAYDLAVIRVDRNNLPVLVLGRSSAVLVGDSVIAVGAPLGLDSTVTSGIVSALNRPVTAGGVGASSASFINAIQTDAAINPGNSGGPLLDMEGRVIGVNSAIARVASSQSTDGQSGNIGVGFAIPSDQVRKTAEQLIANGKATHPVIGVLLDTAYKGEGVRIAAGSQNGSVPITKGGPADKAGLRPGDVILKLDGRPVTDPDEFVVAVRAKSVGETVQLTVRRGSTERTVKMTLQAAN
jgi:putative serine protease PepD